MTEALTPYARSLGISIHDEEDGAPILTVDFGSNVEGRPQHLHGGATSGLLETAGYAALRAELQRLGRNPRLKPINITVQFLAAGKSRATFAKGSIFRLGRRNAHIEVLAWQDSGEGPGRERPIASAVMNILMAEDED